MMCLALFLVIGAVGVSLSVGSESGQAGAAEVARNILGGPSSDASGVEKESHLSSSSSHSGSARQHNGGEVEGSQSVGTSDSGSSKSHSDASRTGGQQSPSRAHSAQGSGSANNQSQQGGQQVLPAEGNDWPKPTQGEIQAADSPRHFHLLPGAVMSLTIEKLGIYDAPVFGSDSYEALAKGIAHVPGTSWPWSNTPQRNVYLAGHRMGYRGTWSRMLFYNLGELRKGDTIVLKDREGRTYKYRVSESFLAEPTDAWVLGQVRGRDMVSLQTCTPLYTFQKRLIVRADRV
jgi:LPXTG-site transpeptidase (sortase) family protein